jgi:hypothetical protein
MKTTILIYKDINAAEKELRVASHQEWDSILSENRGLPMEKRRCFIKDCFEDNGVLDCMFIEVSLAEYRVWHSQYVKSDRNRREKSKTEQGSLDTDLMISEVDSLYECVSDGFDLEQCVIDRIMMEQLRKKLDKWQPWAVELLDYYISGKKKACTSILSRKYGLSDKTIQKRKKAFEKFVLDFLKK